MKNICLAALEQVDEIGNEEEMRDEENRREEAQRTGRITFRKPELGHYFPFTAGSQTAHIGSDGVPDLSAWR